MGTTTERWRLGSLVAVVAAAGLIAAGCGSSGDDTDTGTAATQDGAASTSTTTDGGGLAVAEKNLQALYDGTNFGQPPAESPKPQAGKNVWQIIVGLGSPSTLLWSNGMKAAGEELGWDVHVFDGQYNPSKWLEGVQQAVAANADGIVLIAVDCAPVKAGLEQARKAGIKIAAIQSADCNDSNPNSQPLFDQTVKYNVGDGSLHGLVDQIDYSQADWVAKQTDGKAKIIILNSDELLVIKWQTEAFKKRLAEICPDCEIVEQVEFKTADLLGPDLRQKIEQSLLKHPEANAFVSPFDDPIVSSGGDAAIRGTGRSDQISVIGATGTAGSLKQIADNKGLDATVTLPFEWEGWALADTLNRAFAGQASENSGIGIGLVDKDHPPKTTSTGEFDPPVDFKAAYKEAWQAAQG